MKAPFFLSLILFSIHTASSLSEQPDPVVDIDGDYLRAGVLYYILPVVRGRGGGLTIAATTTHKTCPLNVVQEQFEVKKGLKLTFRPVDPKKGVVRLSTDQNIKFSAVPTCVPSPVWKLDYNETAQKFFVTAGGVEGNPGPQTLSNWFKIERQESHYKLLFCPTVCNYCKVLCRDVGVVVEDGKRRLTLTEDDPFKIMFKKA